VAIPAAEYALSFAKNLFTLKVFKKADFNNIANLNKDQKEDENQQKRVEKSAKDHIKKAALISGTAIAASAVFAVFGPKSKALQKVSESIFTPE
jgi:predicted phage-related endonuclease